MVKFLFAILLLVTINSVSAQVSATATATATIVGSVGTEEVSNQDLPSILQPPRQTGISFSSLMINNQTKQIDITKFKVMNSTSLFSITIQSNLPNPSIKNSVVTNQPSVLTVKPFHASANAELYSVEATIYSNSNQPNKTFNEFLDVTVHFN